MNQARRCLTLSPSPHQRHLTRQAKDEMDLDSGHAIAPVLPASPLFAFLVASLRINVFAACVMVACVGAMGKYRD
jgi:hypothetical protein